MEVTFLEKRFIITKTELKSNLSFSAFLKFIIKCC